MLHQAVALKYQEGLPAPFIVAKGKKELAERLLAIARKYKIEIVSQPELTEALFTLEVGAWIPEEYFEIIAELLVFVYKAKIKA
ncbi:MAG: EscU/YscU/HrcU family type III secretion system export apparatus switch protein [Spirochaetota bacterium]